MELDILKELVNPWAVLVSAIASMIIGSLWYSPLLFSKPCMAIIGVTPEKITESKNKSIAKSMVIGFISAMVTAFSLSLLIGLIAPNTIAGMWLALYIAFIFWLGFMAVIHLDTVIWEGRPWKYFFINSGCRLVTILAITLILYFWR